MTFWQRASNLDRKIYYALLILVISWPIIKPWGLPIKINKETQGFHDAIDAVPKGGIVAVAVDYRTDCIVELSPMMVCLTNHAFQRGLRLIFWAGVEEGANLCNSILPPIAERHKKVYGVDWISLGYKPGNEATMKKMVDDFWEGSAYTDAAGKQLDNFEIMKGFKSVKQANLLVNICGVTPGATRYIQMITIPTGMPMVVGLTSVDAAAMMPYFASGQFKGLLSGLRGAAEYELLIGLPGPAVMGMDAQSASHILVILLIIFGNLGYLMTRKAQKPGAAGGGGR
jgi:hypothetical protein